jgi:hypothetical protein
LWHRFKKALLRQANIIEFQIIGEVTVFAITELPSAGQMSAARNWWAIGRGQRSASTGLIFGVRKSPVCRTTGDRTTLALAFMNYLCFFHDFPIPLCVSSMLRI